MKRGRIVVELTFDLTDEDMTEKYPGDTEQDFLNRAFERVRPALNGIVGKDKSFAHYHIEKRPHTCVEFD